MLVSVDSKRYQALFNNSPHPYLRNDFILLNKHKVDEVHWLVEDEQNASIGIIVGIKDDKMLSPFSAPFGGFHFRKDNQYISEIESFVQKLIRFAIKNSYNSLAITLPPDLYHLSFNSKCVNTLHRSGFCLHTIDLTNWVDLNAFEGTFKNRGARKYYNQALKNNLVFNVLTERRHQYEAFSIIKENRMRFDRPLYMTFEDLDNVNKLWSVDFFGVYEDDVMVASGVFYRGHDSIVQGVFWGDTELGRPMRAIDFLAFNIWNLYKNNNYSAIDLGISTESGIPNEGLLRFKESHDCITSPKYTFVWRKN